MRGTKYRNTKRGALRHSPWTSPRVRAGGELLTQGTANCQSSQVKVTDISSGRDTGRSVSGHTTATGARETSATRVDLIDSFSIGSDRTKLGNSLASSSTSSLSAFARHPRPPSLHSLSLSLSLFLSVSLFLSLCVPDCADSGRGSPLEPREDWKETGMDDDARFNVDPCGPIRRPWIRRR